MSDTDIINEYSNENPLARHFTITDLLKFIFPTIFMMVFSGLYTMVDTMFVARFVNTDALSYINIVTTVINVIVGIGAMFATGGSAIVARKMGDGNNKKARSNFTMIVITAVVIGMLISIFGLLFINQIIRILGSSDVLFPYAKDYLTIVLIFAPANILQVVFVNLFVTAGITNTVFDYILIVPLQMGIGGAALATSMGYVLQAIVGIIFF